MKVYIKRLIANGRAEKAIQELLRITSNLDDQEFHREIVVQSGRFKDYQKRHREGKSSPEQLNQINFALLQILDELPQDINPKSGKRTWIIGAVVVLGIFGVIAIIHYTRKISTASNSITILVHGPGGKDEKVLPGRGIVKLIYGDAIVPKQINNQCEATFTQISDAFFAQEAGVEILFEDPEGESYRVTHKDSLYRLTRGKYIPLEVKLFGLDKISGIVKDFVTGKPIEGAVIRIQGLEAVSNQYGEYALEIPEEKQLQFQTIREYKDGYQDFEQKNVPTQTKKEMAILMKPVQ